MLRLVRAIGLLVLLLSVGVSAGATPAPVLVGRQADGSVITSTNQRLTPAGKQVEWTAGRPTAVAVSPDGKTAAFLNGDGLAGPEVVAVDLASLSTTLLDTGSESGSLDGLTFSRDGSIVYASDSGGSVHAVPLSGGQVQTITMPGSNPNPAGSALADDGRKLLVALNRNNTLGVLDLASGTVTKEVPVGSAPHSVVVDGNLAYVSNEGGRRPVAGDFVNDSSGTKVVADTLRGAASTGTISVVDVGTENVVGSIDVGLHPTAMLHWGAYLFVANTNSDTISVVDLALRRTISTIDITPFPGAPYGSSPTGLAMIDGNRLAVTVGRNNAVAVFGWNGPLQPATFEGLMPTGWYPSAVAVDAAGKRLVVANDKGVGSLATADHDPSRVTPKVVQEYIASASFIPFPTHEDLVAGSSRVAANNGWDKIDNSCASLTAAPVAMPAHIGEPSTIKHVVFVVKENRTYDQVMGDDTRGNGDPAEATYGAQVTPNQHLMARTWPLFDNFYDSGSLSADGHQWVVQADAPDYLEKAFGGFPRSYPAMGYDALTYLPSGFLWEAAARRGLTVTNFAEYALEGGKLPETSDIPSNDRNLVRDYPGFALNIPDQHRADIFLSHFAQYQKDNKLANLTFVRLPDDHTGGTNPNYPTPAAEVADNDLALGRIVDAISHSQFWKDTAIFVEEDDSQAGSDHVDGHRSTAYLVSPYATRGIVDSTYYTQVNMVRTIEQILGLDPMNQMDLAATPMRSAFTDTPNFAPYGVQAARVSTSTSNPSAASLTGLAREWALASAAQDLTHTDAADERIINRADWYSVKGFNTAYPGDSRVLHPSEVASLPRLPVVAGPEATQQAAGATAMSAGSAPAPVQPRACSPAGGTLGANAVADGVPLLPNTSGVSRSWGWLLLLLGALIAAVAALLPRRRRSPA